MQERHLQMLMAATGDYAGGIDGAFGPMSNAAMHRVEARHRAAYTFDPTSTSQHRRWTACAQACLNQLDHDAGLVWTLLTNRVHPTRHSDSGIVALRQETGEALYG